MDEEGLIPETTSPKEEEPTTEAQSTSINRRDDLTIVQKSFKMEEDGTAFTWTFHVETLRCFAFSVFTAMMFIGFVITEFSGLDTIPPSDQTEIFRLFGFNHECNFIDHNPSRMISAILIPLFTLPMLMYTILFYCRLVARRVSHGDVPLWLVRYYTIILPFNLFTYSILHLWFVNTPEEGYGFIPHYVPYLMWQIAISLQLLANVQYLNSTNNLPWGTKPWMAYTYFWFMAAITILYTIIVITILAGSPILDTKNHRGERIVFQIIGWFYFLNAAIAPIVFSAIERKNGDVHTITFKL